MAKKYDPLSAVQAAGPPGWISFVYGLPDPLTFPVEELRACLEKVLKERASLSLQYAPEQGYGPLLDYLLQKIKKDEGICLERPSITLSGGASQALDHILTIFTSSGESILVEGPTYHESLLLFRNHRLRTFQVPVDAEGLIPAELVKKIEELRRKRIKPQILYTIPTFQNPTGISLSLERRNMIVEIAREYDLLLIEDDVYFDLAYEEQEAPSLFSLSRGKGVLRLGSFSKIISPGLRLGWIQGSEDLIPKLVQSGLRRMGGGANPLIANAISEFCKRGFLARHLEHLKKVYRKRRDLILESMKANFPENVCWTVPRGGFFVWLTLPEPLLSQEVVSRAKEEKVLVLGGEPFFAEKPSAEHIRLSFSYLEPEKIEEGIEKLAKSIKKCLKSLPKKGGN